MKKSQYKPVIILAGAVLLLSILLVLMFYIWEIPVFQWLKSDRPEIFRESNYGLRNQKGRVIVDPRYDSIAVFSEIAVLQRGSEYGVSNKRGKMIIPMQTRPITNEYHGQRLPFLLALRSDGSFTLIDHKGKEREIPVYDSLELREDDIFICRDGLWGVLDGDGFEQVPLIYDQIVKRAGNYFIVRKGNYEGLHSKGSKEPLVPVMYDKVDECTSLTFRVLLDDHYGLLDHDAVSLIETVYDTIYFHHSPEWIVTGDSGRYSLRNTTNLEYPAFFYDIIGPVREGMTVVRNENGYGVLSSDGKVVVQPGYDLIRDYSNGLAIVMQNQQYGVIDRYGNFTLPFSLNLVEIYDFHNELALAARFNMMEARIQKQFGFIDKKGNTIIPFIYQDGHRMFSNGLAGVKFNGLWGFINKKGESMIPFIYDSVSVFSHGMAKAVFQGQLITIDMLGRKME